MSLESDLQEIDGIGPATAERIMAVIDEHDTGGVPTDDIDSALVALRHGRERQVRQFLESLR